MINQENCKKLRELNLPNMASYYFDYHNNLDFIKLDFDDKFAILLDFEMSARKNKRIAALDKKANFKIKTDISTIDYSHERELSKELVLNLAGGDWVTQGKNRVVSGATGTGKSHLSSALGYRVCMYGFKVSYIRVPRLILDISLSKQNGSYKKLMNKYKNVDLLIFDVFGLSKMTASETRDF